MTQYTKSNLSVRDKQLIETGAVMSASNGKELNGGADSYGERVTALIRERYSLSDELAISRQRETKAQDFAEYFAYCEECKVKARESD